MSNPSSKHGHRSLATAANLANLLPTGTVLAAEALIPSFTNNGECASANKYLTLGIVVCCSLACFLSFFTDSFTGKDGKIYYGVATRQGLRIFNDTDPTDDAGGAEKAMMDACKIHWIDFVHAFASLTVSLVFALSNSDVQDCFFPKAGPNDKALIMNLPLGAGFLAGSLFMLFPTKRRGIGYADAAPLPLSGKKGEVSADPSDKKIEREHSSPV